MNNHDEDDDLDFSAYQESGIDPVLREKIEDSMDDKIKERIAKRFSFTDDEIKVSFPTRKALRDFYNDTLKLRNIKDVPADKEKEPVDKFQLPDSQLKDVQARLKQRSAAKKKHAKLLENKGEKMLKDVTEAPEKEMSKTPEIDTANPPGSLRELFGEGFNLDDE